MAPYLDSITRTLTIHLGTREFYGTDNLASYFDTLANAEQGLPTMDSILDDADILVQRYGTYQAFRRALQPPMEEPTIYDVPVGPVWQDQHTRMPHSTNESATLQTTMAQADADETMLVDEQESTEAVPVDEETYTSTSVAAAAETTDETFEGDWPLANSILLIVCGVMFLEAQLAVRIGDTGRVWEIIKVSEYFQ